MATNETKEIKKQLTNVQTRLMELVDELTVFKKDLARFKANVADDVKYLTNRVDNRGNN